MGATRIAGLGIADVVVRFGRSLIAHGIANQATTVMMVVGHGGIVPDSIRGGVARSGIVTSCS